MEKNTSPDLVWEITRGYHSKLCKRRTGGGVQFSRDPLNLRNKHTRVHEGFVNDRAVGIQAGPDNSGVVLMTKKKDKTNKPASQLQVVKFGQNTSSRKVYRSVVANTARINYRADLRADAVARASAIKRSQRPVKTKAEPKPRLRGAKARKAAAAATAASSS